MDKNARLYHAALHLYNAAILLDGIDKDVRQELLGKAETLLDQVEINEDEIKEIENFKDKIKESL